jgi:hypothetical protein
LRFRSEALDRSSEKRLTITVCPCSCARWPNGDVSFVSARNREDAIIALDEWDNAELAELRQIRDFMVDFRLANSGGLELQGFGESCQEEIGNHAYPVLTRALADAPKTGAGEPTSAGKKSIRAAVHTEKERLVGKKGTKLAETELGRSVQNQLGAPSALINRRIKEVATEVLKRAPKSDRKQ